MTPASANEAPDRGANRKPDGLAALVEVKDYTARGWADVERADERARDYCRTLEAGNILLFAETPFPLPDEDRRFLTEVRQTNSAYTKNISYRPQQDRVRGAEGHADRARLHQIMRAYSQSVSRFFGDFLQPYAGGWCLDFASFRSFEEHGRQLAPKARNDLLHVDAFPTRPMNGDRILRVFTNINPVEPRVWLTGGRFESLAGRFAADAGLDGVAARARSPLAPASHAVRKLAGAVGLPVPDHSPYDRFMLGFHDYLKANRAFQDDPAKSRWEFPPGSTWIVFTDMVPHAVLSGRLALEQTFIVSHRNLIEPQQAPVRILENLCKTALTH